MKSRQLQFQCSFQYGSGFALDFEFRTEQPVTALVGPSGSGKTTILRLISGLLRPREGSIAIEDRVLFDSLKKIDLKPEQRKIGVVFQDYLLFPHLSVEANLRYGQRRNRSNHLTFVQVVEVLQLGNLLTRAPMSLSGGQKQRVALGRAMLSGPSLLLLDEPLSAIDPEHREEVIEFLSKAIRESNTPTILVSHDRETVMRFTSTIIHLTRPSA